jgi:hypothetical protein
MHVQARRIVLAVGLFAAGVSGVGCATTKQARDVTPDTGGAAILRGDEIALLQKNNVDGPLLKYKNPAARWSGYTKAIVMPVKFEKPEGASEEDLQNLQKMADTMHGFLAEQVAHVLEIVTEPGPDTLRIESVIYDAQNKKTALNFITGVFPVGVLVNLVVTAARGKPTFVGELSGELTITDATSGELLAANVDRRVGRKYQSAEFSGSGEAYDATEFWAKQTRYDICQWKAMTDCPTP